MRRSLASFVWGRTVSCAVVGSMLLQSLPAYADPSPTERALAESLFREGRDQMAAGKYAEACPKLRDSQRLDPAIGTLLNLAVCHEQEGKLASAWLEFQDAAQEARAGNQAEREKMARRHVQQLEPQLARLEILVDAQGTEGIEVLLDGAALPRGAWGTAFPVDPGDHAIEARAPGRKSYKGVVSVASNGVRLTTRVPALELATEGGPPSRAIVETRNPETPPPATSSTQRTVGFVVGGVGVVGLVVSAIAGIRVFALKSERSDSCDASNVCRDENGVRADENARSMATVSTVSFIAGAALVAGGIALILTAPRSTAAKPGTPLARRELMLGGSF